MENNIIIYIMFFGVLFLYGYVQGKLKECNKMKKETEEGTYKK